MTVETEACGPWLDAEAAESGARLFSRSTVGGQNLPRFARGQLSRGGEEKRGASIYKQGFRVLLAHGIEEHFIPTDSQL